MVELHLLPRREVDPATRKLLGEGGKAAGRVRLDRKSTRLNSSHVSTSYAVFCLKKKKGYRPPRWCPTARSPPTAPGLRSLGRRPPSALPLPRPPRTRSRFSCVATACSAATAASAALTPHSTAPGAGPSGALSRTSGCLSRRSPTASRRPPVRGPSPSAGPTGCAPSRPASVGFFFLNYPPPTETSTLSLHDALPI